MKKMILTVFFVIFAVAVCYASGEAESYDEMVEILISKTVPVISTDELQTLTNSETEFIILDTRESEEYEISRIKNSINTGFDDFQVRNLIDIPKSASIIVYCSVGYRSGEIGKLLTDAGYENVLNLYGGIFKWFNEEKPVYDSEGPTDRIHGYSARWAKWLTRGRIEN